MFKRSSCHFTPEPGDWDEKSCDICGELCDVTRDCEGPTSSVMAMGGSKRKYDFFYCKNSDEDWHEQAFDLIHEFNKTSSPSLRRMIDNDVSMILESRKVLDGP